MKNKKIIKELQNLNSEDLTKSYNYFQQKKV